MATNYTFILRECPAAAKAGVALFLGKAFSLKDSTCTSIAESAPIILLPELTADEAAAIHLILSGLVRLGAVTDLVTNVGDDLPKIDWPRRPQVFKRDIADIVADLHMTVSGANGPVTILSLLAQAGGLGVAGPVAASDPVITPGIGTHQPASSKPAEFRGIQLPEITPFGGVPSMPQASLPVRPPTGKVVSPRPTAPEAGGDEAMARLNELFPEDESSGFLPNNQDITSILNKLLPDEDGSSSSNTPASGSSNRMNSSGGSHGHAVFLAKIADEGRRQKAVELISELSKISKEEADVLSKKVIIPVLKGATKEEAEAAKARFAKIGILARIKAPDGG